MPERTAVVVALPRGGSLDAFRGAAYRLLERAHARLDLRGGRVVARLTPRSARDRAGLADAFRAAYEGELRRAAARRRGRAAEAAILSRALVLARAVDAKRRDEPETLSPEAEAEIARLLAEAEAAPRKDPLGLRRTWSAARREGA